MIKFFQFFPAFSIFLIVCIIYCPHKVIPALFVAQYHLSNFGETQQTVKKYVDFQIILKLELKKNLN